jgi:preprotein translocase subunit SecA
MDELKSVQLGTRARSPLLIYKFEAFNLFNGILTESIRVISFLFKGDFTQQAQKFRNREVARQKKFYN